MNGGDGPLPISHGINAAAGDLHRPVVRWGAHERGSVGDGAEGIVLYAGLGNCSIASRIKGAGRR